MKDWEKLVKDLNDKNFSEVKNQVKDYDIYPESLREKDGSFIFMTRIDNQKRIIIVKKGNMYDRFEGQEREIEEVKIKIVPLNHQNAEVLRDLFDFTSPAPKGKQGASLGLGDRIGLASPGHIHTIKDKNIKPVLAQQSIRELELTERDYDDVLDAASWAVFQEGYEKGFGADGDHLKNEEEVNMALEKGFSMITLDGSEYIDNSIDDLDENEVNNRYKEVKNKENIIVDLEEKYLEKTFTLETDTEINFNKERFQRIILTYFDLLNFTEDIYNKLIVPVDRQIDFEVSIDETQTPTSPQAHYFVASELIERGLEINSLAPRFCGEFQKAIDYIGDIDQFEKEYKIHAQIADEFGYKLSIHSGSDKFSVYPLIGKYTDGRVHVKTAGTNWLEALRVIAENEPDLFREIHNYAMDNYEEATKYYHVTTDFDNIPDITELTDSELTELFDHEDARQMLHITYGVIMKAEADDGTYLFRDKMYRAWNQYEEEYSQVLQKHIGKHVDELGFE